MKKFFYLSLVAVLATTFNAVALSHGSMVGMNEPMSLRYNDSPQGAMTDKKVDFKIVTVGAKTWFWTNFNGTLLETTAFNASQFRYRVTATPSTAPGNRVEEPLRGRVTGTQQSFGMATPSLFPTANPFYFSIYQAEGPNVATEAFETAIKSYNKTIQNSKDAADVTAPAWVTCDFDNFGGTSVDLELSITEASGKYFYYIVDTANGIEQVSFWDNYQLTGLTPGTEYNLSITAIDFSGNESETKVLNLGAQVATSINSGISQGLYFQIGSTATELTVFARPVAATATITGAEIKFIEYGKGDVTALDAHVAVLEDWAGVPSFTYKMPHSFPIGTLVEINLGYLLGPILTPPVMAEEWALVYENYVRINRVVTEGADKGKVIVHIIGENGITKGLKTPAVAKEVAKKQFFTIDGRAVAAPTSGIYIVKKIFTDGSIGTEKVLVK